MKLTGELNDILSGQIRKWIQSCSPPDEHTLTYSHYLFIPYGYLFLASDPLSEFLAKIHTRYFVV